MKYIQKCEQEVSPEDINALRRATMILAEWLDSFQALYEMSSERLSKLERVVSLILNEMWVEVENIPATSARIELKKKSKKRK